MKWLTLEYIKAHARITHDIENELLTSYGEVAEEAILNLLNRTYEDLLATYGEVPKAIVQASVLLAAQWYNDREAVASAPMSAIPYNFDFILKPYIVL